MKYVPPFYPLLEMARLGKTPPGWQLPFTLNFSKGPVTVPVNGRITGRVQNNGINAAFPVFVDRIQLRGQGTAGGGGSPLKRYVRVTGDNGKAYCAGYFNGAALFNEPNTTEMTYQSFILPEPLVVPTYEGLTIDILDGSGVSDQQDFICYGRLIDTSTTDGRKYYERGRSRAGLVCPFWLTTSDVISMAVGAKGLTQFKTGDFWFEATGMAQIADGPCTIEIVDGKTRATLTNAAIDVNAAAAVASNETIFNESWWIPPGQTAIVRATNTDSSTNRLDIVLSGRAYWVHSEAMAMKLAAEVIHV